MKAKIKLWFGAWWGGWFVTILDMAAICILVTLLFAAIRTICNESSPWALVVVPAALFAPIWAALRITLAWKDNENAKRERREVEERQKRILQERSGKN